MVNGIDNQIMITRTAEYARQLADRVNQVENAKAFAAQIEKERAVQNEQSVRETEHSENKVVRRDKEKGSGKEGGQHNPQDRDQGLTENEEQTVMPSETLGKEIDITV